MIPSVIARHPLVRSVTALLIVGGMVLAVLRYFTPGRTEGVHGCWEDY